MEGRRYPTRHTTRRLDQHPEKFSSSSHLALIFERFKTPRLTFVCHRCSQTMGETKMSEKSATTYTVLYMCSKLRVPPHALLAQSREVAAKIASVEGLIWKIWIHRESENAMGGV